MVTMTSSEARSRLEGTRQRLANADEALEVARAALGLGDDPGLKKALHTAQVDRAARHEAVLGAEAPLREVDRREAAAQAKEAAARLHAAQVEAVKFTEKGSALRREFREALVRISAELHAFDARFLALDREASAVRAEGVSPRRVYAPSQYPRLWADLEVGITRLIPMYDNPMKESPDA